MSEERDCIVKLIDDHGVEHSFKVRAESAYEAALKGLRILSAVGWESDGSTMASVLVEPNREKLVASLPVMSRTVEVTSAASPRR